MMITLANSRFGRLVAALGVGLALVFVTGCGGGSGGTSDGFSGRHVEAEPRPDATMLDIRDELENRFETDVLFLTAKITPTDIIPAGERLLIEVEQPVVIYLDAQQAGALHVDSSPQQLVSYPAGVSVVVLEFEQLGLIKVKDQELDRLLVELEVT